MLQSTLKSVSWVWLLHCDQHKNVNKYPSSVRKPLSDSAKKSLMSLTNAYSSDICLRFSLLSYSLM